MKIENDKTLQKVLKPEPLKGTIKKGDVFRDILSEVQSKTGESGEEAPIRIDRIEQSDPGTRAVSAATRLQAGSFTPPAGDNRSHLEKVEDLLDLLQSYSEALSDPGKNLRQLSPLVSQLESEKEKLQTLENTLPDGDELQALLKQALILTQVEVSRFNRGDYL